MNQLSAPQLARVDAYIAGLRELATFLEKHPELAPHTGYESLAFGHLDTKDEAAGLMRALGGCNKEYSGEHLSIARKFAGVEVRWVFYRKQVCERKVVGVKHHEEVTLPAQPERVIPARDEEIVEWDCGPILQPTDAQVKAAA